MLSKKQLEAGVAKYSELDAAFYTPEQIVEAIYRAMVAARSDRRKVIEAIQGFEKLSKIQNAARRG